MIGREADIAYLNHRLQTSTTIRDRNRTRDKLRQIHKQVKDRRLQELRMYLLHAERIDNSVQAEHARNAIRIYSEKHYETLH
jgi:hypothetical protein